MIQHKAVLVFRCAPLKFKGIHGNTYTYTDRTLVISFKIMNGGNGSVTEERRAVSWYLKRQKRIHDAIFLMWAHVCHRKRKKGKGREREGQERRGREGEREGGRRTLHSINAPSTYRRTVSEP